MEVVKLDNEDFVINEALINKPKMPYVLIEILAFI